MIAPSSSLEQSCAADSCAATVGDPEENMDDVAEDLKGPAAEAPSHPLQLDDRETGDYVDCPIVQDNGRDKSVTVTAMTELSGAGADSGRCGGFTSSAADGDRRDSSTQHKSRKVRPLARFFLLVLWLLFVA